MTGYVYFVKDEASGLIKIGFTAYSPHQRIQNGGTFNPNVLVLLGVIRGEKSLERKLHKIFNAQRRHREWFAPNAKLRAFIKNNAVEYVVSSRKKRYEKTTLVQTYIPVSLFASMVARSREEMCSIADLVRRAILFTEENRAKKGKR